MGNGETPQIPLPQPPAPTPAQGYLESGLTIAAALSGIPIVGEIVWAAIFLYNLAEWLVSIFSGVPHDAKTLGAGQVLIHSTDPITAYYGG